MALQHNLNIKISQKWLAYWVSRQRTVTPYSYKRTMKPRNPPLRSLRLLDQVRERIIYIDYILSTKKHTCIGSGFTSAGMVATAR